ncbi:MAG: hypothetical protein KJ645_09585, partial [Planctomycetes bacterium]|nr:hypothetical protein [Planctomycetota bacterium]
AHLQGIVNALYGDFQDPDFPKAVLEMQFILIRHLPNRPEILLQKDYRKSVDLEEATPEALAKGWSRAIAETMRDFEKALNGLNIAYE